MITKLLRGPTVEYEKSVFVPAATVEQAKFHWAHKQ